MNLDLTFEIYYYYYFYKTKKKEKPIVRFSHPKNNDKDKSTP